MTYNFLELNFLELISTMIGCIIIICAIFICAGSIFINKISLKLYVENEKEEIYDLSDFVEVESNDEVFKLFRNKKTDVYERFDITAN